MKSKLLVTWTLIGTVMLGASGSLRSEEMIADCSADPPCLGLFEQAKNQSDQGNLTEALRLYKLAYSVRPDPKLLYSIARILHKLGQSQEAIPFYQQFIESPLNSPADLEHKRKARLYIAEIQASVPVEPAPPNLTSAGRNLPEAGIVSLPEQATERSTRRPLYKQWWLWQLVATTVAIGISGTVAGIYASDGRAQ